MDARQIFRPHPLRAGQAGRAASLKALLLASGIALLSACGGGDGTNPEQAAIHMRSSEAYSQQGQYRAAMIEARNAIKMAPDRLDGHLQLAGIYNQLGDGRSAARILEPLLEQAPERVALSLAQAWNLQAKFRSTHDQLQRDDLPTGVLGQPQYRPLLAEALGGMGEHERALELYRQLLAEDDRNTEARLGIARVQLLGGDHGASEATLEELLAQQPRHAEALFLKAQIAFARNQLEDAERGLTDALSYLPQTDVITPLKARVLRQLSETLTRLGRPSEALVYSRLLAEATPGAQEARQRFNDALELFQSGDLEAAERILLDLYQVNPDNDLSGMLLGLVAYQKGEFDQADQLFQQHVDPETAAPQMIEAAALAQLQLQRPREALDMLKEALRGHEQNANLQAIYGMAALRYPDTREEGALALQKALAIDPSRSRLRIPLANHYLQEGKIEQAEAQLQTAASQAPGDTRVQGGYIAYLLNKGDVQRAQQVMRAFLQSTPNELETRLLAGQVAAMAGELDNARDHYRKAQELAPDNAAPLFGLAQIAVRHQNWEEAANLYRRAAELDPTQPAAYKGLITSFEARGQAAQGIAAVEAEAAREERAPVALAVLGEYFLRHNDAHRASDFINRALDRNREHTYIRDTYASIQRALASTRLGADDHDGARDAIMAALEMFPEHISLLSDLVGIETAAGRTDEAKRIIERIRNQPGAGRQAQLMEAHVMEQHGDVDSAADTLRQLWRSSGDTEVADRLYQLHQRTQTDPGSLLADWQQRHPQDPRPVTYLALAAQIDGRQADAIGYYQQALELAPNNALILNNLAWLYHETGDDRATDLARRAMELAPDNPAILDTYGWVLVNQGQVREGIRYLEQAAALAPESPDIQSHLEQARKRL